MRNDCDRDTFRILRLEMIRATVTEIQQIHRFYTNDAEKDTIINDDEKFQLISVKTTNTPYFAYSCSNQFRS